MMTTETTPSEPIGTKLTKIALCEICRVKMGKYYTIVDPLVDRDCGMLDGNCNCKNWKEDCKYLKEKT
jgi:hypothetical protein